MTQEQLSTFASIATITYCIAFIISLFLLLWQIRRMRKSTTATAFAKALEILQNESIRNARKVIFNLKKKQLSDWTDEEKKSGEIVMHTYDQVGIMIKSGMFPKELIINNWASSLYTLKDILLPLLEEYRKEYNFKKQWDEFEWLTIEAVIYYNKNKMNEN